MATSLFGTALSGLNAAQRGLATAGHNISNVDTPGYSRQRIDQAARPPQFAGSGYLGSGVQVDSVRRVYDGFVTSQLRTSQAATSRLETLHELSAAVDRLVGSSGGNLGPAMQQFFGAVQDATVDPTSLAARQALLSEGEALAQRVVLLDDQLASQTRALDQRMDSVVGEINVLAGQVADLNRRIVEAEGRAAGRPANDLRDQRDEAVRQLSSLVDVTAVDQDGFVNLSVARGQLLVAGSTAGSLTLVGGEYDGSRREVGLALAGSTVTVSTLIGGGELGGILQFRDEVLDPARNAVGRIAIGISEDVNLQHRLGQDLEGQPGGDFFRPLAAAGVAVFASADNTSGTPATVAVTVTDPGSLTTSDYLLQRSGAAFELRRLDDGVTTTLPGSFPAQAVEVDGLRLSVTAGAMADGDSFLVAPTRQAAAGMAMALTDPRDVALAAPVRAAVAASNVGNVQLSQPVVNSPHNTLAVTFNTPPTTFDVVDETSGARLASGVSYSSGASVSFNGLSFAISDSSGPPAAGDRFEVVRGVSAEAAGNTGGAGIGVAASSPPDPALRDPVTITFDDPPGTFTVSGASTGSPTVAVPYVSGQPVSFDGWSLTLTGTPAAGDSFTVGPNTGGVGDNRNGLLIAGLQAAGRLEEGASSYGEAYGTLIARTGSLTRQAEIGREAQASVLTQLEEARASTSGVNLDEEAADLLRYQQAYQASAQMIRTADELFQTLLGVVQG